MKTASTIFYYFIGLTFVSCEACKDRAGKEKFQISQSILGIEIDNVFSFSKQETEKHLLYSTGWINSNRPKLKVTVYSGATVTSLDFAVQDDSFLYVILSDTSESLCSQIDHTPHRWETLVGNNIQACFYYEELDCP